MTQQKHMATQDTTHDAYAHTCNEGVFTFVANDTIAALKQHDRYLLIQRLRVQWNIAMDCVELTWLLSSKTAHLRSPLSQISIWPAADTTTTH